jgi:hypothetical protein
MLVHPGWGLIYPRLPLGWSKAELGSGSSLIHLEHLSPLQDANVGAAQEAAEGAAAGGAELARQAKMAAEVMHAQLTNYANRLKIGGFITAENLSLLDQPALVMDMTKALRVSGCCLLVNGGRAWASRLRLGRVPS